MGSQCSCFCKEKSAKNKKKDKSGKIDLQNTSFEGKNKQAKEKLKQSESTEKTPLNKDYNKSTSGWSDKKLERLKKKSQENDQNFSIETEMSTDSDSSFYRLEGASRNGSVVATTNDQKLSLAAISHPANIATHVALNPVGTVEHTHSDTAKREKHLGRDIAPNNDDETNMHHRTSTALLEEAMLTDDSFAYLVYLFFFFCCTSTKLHYLCTTVLQTNNEQNGAITGYTGDNAFQLRNNSFAIPGKFFFFSSICLEYMHLYIALWDILTYIRFCGFVEEQDYGYQQSLATAKNGVNTGSFSESGYKGSFDHNPEMLIDSRNVTATRQYRHRPQSHQKTQIVASTIAATESRSSRQ
ncbi:hypothetical protein RFI_10821 [Reticulomyxa filosa]|uniref:Uncharacterized protein n=1 Tax=Reticulomyxa filosa TaxID=46433 RepID=X6NJ10_RETFI|nr:hypothetical protein RFI_10821 [Reticulomyxa filosa]|eukprot:ETO26315.1 hypothetical protein RFI_10821 [Reticulomyxa filosa]